MSKTDKPKSATSEVAAKASEASEVSETPKVKKRVTGIAATAKLTVIAKDNKKRGASADRFNGYLKTPAPKTVQEALDNGLTMGDIAYDIVHGSIQVEGTKVEEYEPKPRGSGSAKPKSAEDVVVEVVGAADGGMF